jgi:hypothetical protein
MNKEIISSENAQRIAERFLRDKYYGAEIHLHNCKLVEMDNLPPFPSPITAYRVEGDFEIRSRGGLMYPIVEFLSSRNHFKTSFTILIHATSSKILSWEFK